MQISQQATKVLQDTYTITVTQFSKMPINQFTVKKGQTEQLDVQRLKDYILRTPIEEVYTCNVNKYVVGN